MISPSKRSNGAMLILAMWALLLLSAVILAWVKGLDQDIVLDSEANRGLEAKALAHSGVRVALHPLVSRPTPLLQASFGPQRSYNVKMVGEGGKLNLNWLLAGEEPRKLTILKSYLISRGLTFDQMQVLVDSLLDWVDADDVHHLNGMEEQGDYRAANRPLRMLDEVAEVQGSWPLVSIPGWEDDLTIYSQGQLDLLTAPRALLAALPNVGEARAERFLQVRRGPDGIDGTKDDHQFKDMAEVQSYLGLPAQQFAELSGLVAMNDPVWRIVSVGTSGKATRQVEVVARKVQGSPTILLWKEL
jgi:type II secretory pathway component PulK